MQNTTHSHYPESDIRAALPYDAPSSAPHGDTAPPNLHEYLAVIRKRSVLILAITTAAFMAALVIVTCTAPRYTAATLLEIRGYAPLLSNVQSEVLFGNDTRKIEYQKTTVAKLNLAGLADQILSREGISARLTRYWQSRESYLSQALTQLRRWVQPAAATTTTPETAIENSASDPHFVHRPAAINRYLSLVEITPLHETNLVRIEVTTTQPSLSQLLANAHATAFIEHLQQERHESSAVNLQLLQRQASDLQARVTSAEQALATYAERNKLLTLPNESGGNINIRQIEGLAAMLAQASAQRIKAQSLLEEATSKGAEEGSASDDEITRQLRVTLKTAEAEYASMGSRVTAAFPGMMELGAKVDTLRKAIKQERSRTVAALRSRFQAEQSAEQRLRDQIEHEKSTAHEVSKRLIQYNVLSKEAASLRDLYQAVLKQVKEVEISAQSAASNVFISDYATLPTTPSAPKSGLVVTLFTVVGFGTALLVAFMIESFDTSVKGSEEVQKLLQLPLLGSVPSFTTLSLNTPPARRPRRLLAAVVQPPIPTTPSEPAQRLLTVSAPTAAVSEALRTIRAGILLSSADHPPRVILVSSAMPGDGKTTIAANVAATLAQAGHRTLLIDADLRRAQLSELFRPTNVPSRAGLTELLTGHAPLEQVVHQTPVGGLSLLPAGARAPNPAELLGSQTLQTLLVQLQNRYDFILVDTPPVLPVADTLMLSRLADSVILVVRSNSTERKLAQEARRRLDRVHARVLGVVLNDTPSGTDGYAVVGYA